MKIADLFKSKTAPAAPPPVIAATEPSVAKAPFPQAEWRIVVDKEGHPIRNRPAQPGDMLARPALAYHFGGTLPHFEPQKHRGLTGNVASRIDYDVADHANQTVLNHAVFLLSQDDDARRLLQIAHDKGFSIVFDIRRLQEARANGLMDYENKLIPVRPSLNVYEMALTLKHELEHMDQFMHQRVVPSPGMTLEGNLRATRAIEASARVSEAATAVSLMIGEQRGPKDQFKTDMLYRTLAHKSPEVGARMVGALGLAVARDWKNFAAAVFPGFYESSSLMAYYDRSVIDPLLEFNPADIAQGRLMRHDTLSAADIMARLTTRMGAPYLRGRTDIDLDAPLYRRLAEKSRDLFATLWMHIETRAGLDPVPLIGGLRLPDPEPAPELKADRRTAPPQAEQGGWLQSWFRPRAVNAVPVPPVPVLPPKPETAVRGAIAPVRLPDRIDGHVLSHGETEHQHTTRRFTKIYEAMARHGLDERLRLELSLEDYDRGNPCNIRGSMNELLRAGFLAPVGAFPEEYIIDLCRRFQGAGQSGSAQRGWPAVSTEEKALVTHWRALAASGQDPVWSGDTEIRNNSYVKVILRYTGLEAAPAKPAASPAP